MGKIAQVRNRERMGEVRKKVESGADLGHK